MDELTRLQLITEAILEFKTQIKNDLEIDKMGEVVLEIVENSQDPQLYELVKQAYDQRHEHQVAIDILNEAMSYMHSRIEQLTK